MPKGRIEKPAEAPQKPPAPKPLVAEDEQMRTKNSTKDYVLTDEQLAEIIAKYGAPTMPLKNRGKHEGKGVMHRVRPAKDPKNTRKRA